MLSGQGIHGMAPNGSTSHSSLYMYKNNSNVNTVYDLANNNTNERTRDDDSQSNATHATQIHTEHLRRLTQFQDAEKISLKLPWLDITKNECKCGLKDNYCWDSFIFFAFLTVQLIVGVFKYNRYGNEDLFGFINWFSKYKCSPYMIDISKDCDPVFYGIYVFQACAYAFLFIMYCSLGACRDQCCDCPKKHCCNPELCYPHFLLFILCTLQALMAVANENKYYSFQVIVNGCGYSLWFFYANSNMLRQIYKRLILAFQVQYIFDFYTAFFV